MFHQCLSLNIRNRAKECVWVRASEWKNDKYTLKVRGNFHFSSAYRRIITGSEAFSISPSFAHIQPQSTSIDTEAVAHFILLPFFVSPHDDDDDEKLKHFSHHHHSYSCTFKKMRNRQKNCVNDKKCWKGWNFDRFFSNLWIKLKTPLV